MHLALRKVPFFLNHPVEISLYSVGFWHWSRLFRRSLFPSSSTHVVVSWRPSLLKQQCLEMLTYFLKYFVIYFWHSKSKYMEMASNILFSNYYHKTYSMCLQV